MSEKVQSTIVNTIPLWKSQMVLALGVTHSQQAAQAQREVTDMTNELLRKNAQTLKMATIETAKESERGIVDIETLKATQRIADFYSGRSYENPGRRQTEAQRCGSGTGTNRRRAQTETAPNQRINRKEAAAEGCLLLLL